LIHNAICSVLVRVLCRYTLADSVGLASLALQRVLLVGEVLVHLLVAASGSAVLLNLLLVFLDLLLIHLAQSLHGKLDVCNQSITSAVREVLADNNTHHLQTLGVGSHGVCRDDPTTLSELMGDGELVKLVAVLRIKTEGDQRKTLAASFRHKQEAHLLNGGSQVVCSFSQVEHDGAVALLAKTDQLVVLTQNLRSSTREVESERSLIGTKVVDVEDQLGREVLGVTPDAPANTGVDKTVLVARDVDGDDLLETEVPDEIGVDERCNEATRCGINCDI
jgi:hypothetical protein